MFSLDKFYNILHNNLISQLNGKSVYFYPFGTYQETNILSNDFDAYSTLVDIKSNTSDANGSLPFFHCYFFDQEPLFDDTVPIIERSFLNSKIPDQLVLDV